MIPPSARSRVPRRSPTAGRGAHHHVGAHHPADFHTFMSLWQPARRTPDDETCKRYAEASLAGAKWMLPALKP